MTHFDTIHSIDRLSLLEALVKEAEKSRAVSIRLRPGEHRRGGAKGRMSDRGSRRLGRCSACIAAAACRTDGIPPLGVEPAPYFALLAKIARRHDVMAFSIGMSRDFKDAIMLGATAVRVGTALFED